MIGKIAVSAANFAIDKPYSYRIPENMRVLPGMRVQLPFGRANKRTEGVVLTVEPGDEAGLKAIEQCLDQEPVLTERQLRLAAFIRGLRSLLPWRSGKLPTASCPVLSRTSIRTKNAAGQLQGLPLWEYTKTGGAYDRENCCVCGEFCH